MIINWLRKFLYGRYNKLDGLNIALFTISIILSLTNRWFIRDVTAAMILSIVSALFGIFAIIRFLSKNTYARMHENEQFLKYAAPLIKTFKINKVRFKERKINRIVVCRSCKTMLRLPKGKKNIVVTCPKCGNKFDI